MNDLEKYLSKYDLIFWDFDGVIKDSIDVKTDAFYEIFLQFGKNISDLVKTHHEMNGGMSRYEKIPIYLKLANQKPDEFLVQKISEDFSKKVVQRVINSPWVEKTKKYLDEYNHLKRFVLVTATPSFEIKYILKSLEIDYYFQVIYGAPIDKCYAIQEYLKNNKIPSGCAVMVGDSRGDMDAAIRNNIDFVLRKTSYNKDLLNTGNFNQFK